MATPRLSWGRDIHTHIEGISISFMEGKRPLRLIYQKYSLYDYLMPVLLFWILSDFHLVRLLETIRLLKILVISTLYSYSLPYGYSELQSTNSKCIWKVRHNLYGNPILCILLMCKYTNMYIHFLTVLNWYNYVLIDVQNLTQLICYHFNN